MCKLFGVNYTIHNINYSRNSKNSFRITEVRGRFVLLTCMGITYVKVKLHSISIYMNFITCHRGGSRILKRGGHNFVTVSMVIVCKVHNLACKACQI